MRQTVATVALEAEEIARTCTLLETSGRDSISVYAAGRASSRLTSSVSAEASRRHDWPRELRWHMRNALSCCLSNALGARGIALSAVAAEPKAHDSVTSETVQDARDKGLALQGRSNPSHGRVAHVTAATRSQSMWATARLVSSSAVTSTDRKDRTRALC